MDLWKQDGSFTANSALCLDIKHGLIEVYLNRTPQLKECIFFGLKIQF